MPRSFRDVTDAELAVLQLLWNRGPSTIRELTSVLYPEGTPAQYATVQKLLQRLEAKACVRRDRNAPVHVFQASINRGSLIDQQLRKMAAKLCDGSLTPLLTHLVRAEKLSNSERDFLRDLVESLDENPPEPGPSSES